MSDNRASELQYIEKGLKGAEELRREALTRKDMYEKQVVDFDKDLDKLGTTAEQGKKEMEEIDRIVDERIAKLKASIPFKLLESKGYIK